MLSAFGVDHGEITKSVLPPKGPPNLTGVTGRLTRAQARTQGKGGATGGSKVKRTLHQIGEADISIKGLGSAAGGGLRNVGGFFERRPGLTGTALVGGGSIAGYRHVNRKKEKR